MMIAANDDQLGGEGTYLVSSIRVGRQKRQQVRVDTPDAALTANAGLAAITELCDRLDVIGALNEAVGPVERLERGLGPGSC
jgi:hypothetical protein